MHSLAGLLITYDLTGTPGDRVLSAMVKCADCQVPEYQPLDVHQVYTVLMNSYQAGGGGGFGVVKENKLSHVYGELKGFSPSNY